MFTTSICGFLLACLAVSVHSYSLGFRQLQCPEKAEEKLDQCLTTVERSIQLDLLPENCGAVMEAVRCSRQLLRACMNANDGGILKVLSSHDPTVIFRVKPLCL